MIFYGFKKRIISEIMTYVNFTYLSNARLLKTLKAVKLEI